MFKETQLFDLSDVSKYQWTEILKLTNSRKCEEYSKVFREKAEEYLSSGDNVAQEIFLFLSKVTALWIGDCLINEEIISNEFSDHELDFLRE
ncbi:MAG: hypothetical protein AB4372_16405 [Xenococcus sp. (in: cyanobacteria)]